MYSLPFHYGTAHFFASVKWAHWVTNQNRWLQSWLTHRLYSIKHYRAHKTKRFAQTLPTVEFSPSSFPESEKETTQKINLVAERTVKDSGDELASTGSHPHEQQACFTAPSGAPLASCPHPVSPRTVSLPILADWLFHFLFAPLILFCIPLWGENNPNRTRPTYRIRYLIFSFWIINKESVSLPFLWGCHIYRFPTHSVFLLKQENSGFLITSWHGGLGTRFEFLLPEASTFWLVCS